MKIHIQILWLVITFTALSSYATGPLAHGSKIITSHNGRCFFKMIPKQYIRRGNKSITKEAFGMAYIVDPKGDFHELWRVSGWYSSEVYLSRNGDYLVRLHSHFNGAPQKNAVALAFYKNGKLLKQYSAIDLVGDPKAVTPIAGGHLWTPTLFTSFNKGVAFRITPKLNEENIFQITSCNRISYQFDATTGNIINKRQQ